MNASSIYKFYLVVAAGAAIILTIWLFSDVYAQDCYFYNCGGQSSSPQQGPTPVIIVDPPPDYYINETYIPDWQAQYEQRLREWRLRDRQRPDKGQQWIDEVPKGDRFRR